VAEVRAGLGFLAAIGLHPEADAAAPARLVAGAREKGVLARAVIGGVAMSPPLTSEQEHIDLLVEGLRAGLDAV
jgi:putrescine---pyruvate transaminase